MNFSKNEQYYVTHKERCASVAQSVEQVTLNHWVHGSSPCRRTNYMVVVAQLVRAPGCGPGGRRFKSGLPPHFFCPNSGGALWRISDFFALKVNFRQKIVNSPRSADSGQFPAPNSRTSCCCVWLPSASRTSSCDAHAPRILRGVALLYLDFKAKK